MNVLVGPDQDRRISVRANEQLPALSSVKDARATARLVECDDLRIASTDTVPTRALREETP
jgi:hypothetical protein